MSERRKLSWQKLYLVWAGALAFIGSLSCEGPQTVNVGGQTHFLESCDASTGGNVCGADLSCISDVCTLTCSEETDCSAHVGAECVLASGAATKTCDVLCNLDRDCAEISDSHTCVRGACRAGVEDGPPGPSLDCVAGDLESSQVLLMGDSFFAASHEIGAQLSARAREVGALSEGAEFRDASSLLNNALAYMDGGLAGQYTESTLEADVRFVIMNGGGADVVLGTCATIDESCPILTEAAQAAEDLFVEMAEGGVKNVLYVFYPHPEDGQEKERMDALRPLIESRCLQAPLSCHFLDLRPIFEGNYEDYILDDGLNPTDAGADATAGEIWSLLQSCLFL